MTNYPNHDFTKRFTGTTDEAEKVYAEIEALQPYTDRQLWEAGNHIRCPNCGELADYDVFQTGETWNGDTEREWGYDCHHCGWHSKSFEWTGDDDSDY